MVPAVGDQTGVEVSFFPIGIGTGQKLGDLPGVGDSVIQRLVFRGGIASVCGVGQCLDGAPVPRDQLEQRVAGWLTVETGNCAGDLLGVGYDGITSFGSGGLVTGKHGNRIVARGHDVPMP